MLPELSAFAVHRDSDDVYIYGCYLKCRWQESVLHGRYDLEV